MGFGQIIASVSVAFDRLQLLGLTCFGSPQPFWFQRRIQVLCVVLCGSTLRSRPHCISNRLVRPKVQFVSLLEKVKGCRGVNDLRMDNVTSLHGECMTEQKVVGTVVVVFLSGRSIDLLKFSPNTSRERYFLQQHRYRWGWPSRGYGMWRST